MAGCRQKPEGPGGGSHRPAPPATSGPACGDGAGGAAGLTSARGEPQAGGAWRGMAPYPELVTEGKGPQGCGQRCSPEAWLRPAGAGHPSLCGPDRGRPPGCSPGHTGRPGQGPPARTSRVCCLPALGPPPGTRAAPAGGPPRPPHARLGRGPRPACPKSCRRLFFLWVRRLCVRQVFSERGLCTRLWERGESMRTCPEGVLRSGPRTVNRLVIIFLRGRGRAQCGQSFTLQYE